MPICHARFYLMLPQTSTDEIAEEKINDLEEGYIYSLYVIKYTIMNRISHLIRLYKSMTMLKVQCDMRIK